MIRPIWEIVPPKDRRKCPPLRSQQLRILALLEGRGWVPKAKTYIGRRYLSGSTHATIASLIKRGLIEQEKRHGYLHLRLK